MDFHRLKMPTSVKVGNRWDQMSAEHELVEERVRLRPLLAYGPFLPTGKDRPSESKNLGRTFYTGEGQ